MRFGTRLPTLFFLIIVGWTAGCDQTALDPFDNDERYFTVWGYLDQMETQHAVRVVPVTRFAENILNPHDDQSFLDAKVFSTDLTTQQRLQWTHKLVQLEDGTWGHTFSGRFIVRPGHTYRLEVIRSDGKSSVAETTVPRIVEAKIMQVSEPEYSPDSTTIWQDVVIPGIPSPWDLRAIYVAGSTTNFRIQVPYGRIGERTEDGAWKTRVEISRDQEKVHAYLRSLPDERGATLAAQGLQLRILDADWDPPEGIFDPEILAQPDVLTNVTHGFGFFGSIGFHVEEWPPSIPQRLLGYPLP